ncbi:MAG: energy transducer TonB [Povalibacter sp.]
MERPESGAAFAPTTHSGPDKTSTVRLVIRARILSDAPPESTRKHRLDRRALALLFAFVALLTLIWIGISMFRSHPISELAVRERSPRVVTAARPPAAPNQATRVTADKQPSKPAPSAIESAPAASTSAAPESVTSKPASTEKLKEPDASAASVNEVVPDVPQSALQTIRGTIRVSIQVTLNPDGTVLAASSRVPGPSRYFERLALQSAKKWTFTPVDTQKERTAFVRFSFTRDGVDAGVEHPG